MATKDKLTKEQVLSIPRRLRSQSIRQVATEWHVTWHAVWYHVRKLRAHGIEVVTGQKGKPSVIYTPNLKDEIYK